MTNVRRKPSWFCSGVWAPSHTVLCYLPLQVQLINQCVCAGDLYILVCKYTDIHISTNVCINMHMYVAYTRVSVCISEHVCVCRGYMLGGVILNTQ